MRFFGKILYATALVLLPTVTTAQDDPSWTLHGSNEITIEQYDVTGDESQSPYPFEGTFWTDRLRLDLGFDDGEYRTFDLQLEGRVADDDYLAEDGGTLETLRLELVGGAAKVPYRLRAGDVFADLSRRTLRRQIKGLSVELQPRAGAFAQSLVVASGSGESEWDEAVDDPDRSTFFTGLSYLIAAPSGRHSLVANAVDVDQRGFPGNPDAASDRDHRLGSLYGETQWGENGVRLEGEVAVLELDDPIPGAEDRQESFYGQLSRLGETHSWKLRYEDNGEYVTPGAVGILADREIAEAHFRWAPRRVGELRLRVQDIESRVEGELPAVETVAYGLSYNGVLIARRSSLRLRADVDRNDIEAEDGSRDQRFTSYRLRLSDRLGVGWDWAYTGSLRQLEDHASPALDRESVEHSLRAGYRWTAAETLRFRARVGAVYREQTESAAFDSWSPVLDVSMRGRRHRLGLHLSFLEQDFAVMTTSDLEYVTQRLTWAWEQGRHLLSLELGQERRDPDGADSTESYRGSLSWRLSFDHAW